MVKTLLFATPKILKKNLQEACYNWDSKLIRTRGFSGEVTLLHSQQKATNLNTSLPLTNNGSFVVCKCNSYFISSTQYML